MVTVNEASAIVLANAAGIATTEVSLESAVGRVLAENIFADRDLPPIDRVTMDGIAIAFDAWAGGTTDFLLSGVQAAGQPQGVLAQTDNCLEIMTGASLPQGADTVVPYEDLLMEARTARIKSQKITQGQNIHRKASDAAKGALLLKAGIIITPAEVALLAMVGKTAVVVFDFPSTAIISTGDELVAVGDSPEPHQVRRSNTLAIFSAMKLMQWPATMFHLPDDAAVVTAQLNKILADHDTVILSGGVSKGKFDFIPAALEKNGIEKRFHRVNQRPGKPFWFGTSGDGKKTVFALPGNPVSTYLCFYRYVRPWILKRQQVEDTPAFAALAHDFNAPSGMTYFLQVAVRNENGMLVAYPDAGGGSGDLANLKDVTGFLEIADGKETVLKGQVFRYFPFRY